MTLPRRSAADRVTASPAARANFARARRAEHQYARQLRKVARQIGDLTRSLQSTPETLAAVLDQYGSILGPWAESVATTMLADVARRDETTWFTVAREMGRALRRELLSSAPTARVFSERRREQVRLIQSLPYEAADRVRRITQEMRSAGGRAAELAEQLAASGEVSRSRANLIARTEVAKTASTLTQVRAEHVGSVAYTWMTARDGDVRPSHRKMSGQLVRWDSPPTLDGMVGHAGQFPNCRCVAVPIIPMEF